MKKPKYLSHYLILTALINDETVSTTDTKAFYTSRIENIITAFRDEGILFQEDAKAISKYSWYKPYILVKTDENLQNAIALQNQYKIGVENFNDGNIKSVEALRERLLKTIESKEVKLSKAYEVNRKD